MKVQRVFPGKTCLDDWQFSNVFVSYLASYDGLIFQIYEFLENNNVLELMHLRHATFFSIEPISQILFFVNYLKTLSVDIIA